MIQASTIPTISPALRLVGATPGAETKQIKLGLKLQPHSLVYEYALFFWPIMLAQGSLQIPIILTKSPNQAYPVSLRKWTSAGLKPSTQILYLQILQKFTFPST